MRRLRFQLLVTWTCLLAFGLNAAVAARVLVRCTDGGGDSRLEWGCDRDAKGHCEAGLGTGMDDGDGCHPQSQPCEDIPAGCHVAALNRVDAGKSLALSPMGPIGVLTHLCAIVPVGTNVMCLCRPHVRSAPPSLWTIRTIVLLV